MLDRLDHVNVFTADLDGFVAWYERVLGLKNGARPAFSGRGAWLYAGDDPVVHVTEVASKRRNEDPGIEHFALTCKEPIDRFLDHLQAQNVAYRLAIVPGLGVIQANIFDPDGNHIHIDFPKDQQERLKEAHKQFLS